MSWLSLNPCPGSRAVGSPLRAKCRRCDLRFFYEDRHPLATHQSEWLKETRHSYGQGQSLNPPAPSPRSIGDKPGVSPECLRGIARRILPWLADAILRPCKEIALQIHDEASKSSKHWPTANAADFCERFWRYATAVACKKTRRAIRREKALAKAGSGRSRSVHGVAPKIWATQKLADQITEEASIYAKNRGLEI